MTDELVERVARAIDPGAWTDHPVVRLNGTPRAERQKMARHHARAAIAEVWRLRPMKIAPRDGAPMLVYVGAGDYAIVFYDEPEDDAPTHCWHQINGRAYHRDVPRGWLPLPPPPEGKP